MLVFSFLVLEEDKEVEDIDDPDDDETDGAVGGPLD
jgi:hypothetical protein